MSRVQLWEGRGNLDTFFRVGLWGGGTRAKNQRERERERERQLWGNWRWGQSGQLAALPGRAGEKGRPRAGSGRGAERWLSCKSCHSCGGCGGQSLRAGQRRITVWSLDVSLRAGRSQKRPGKICVENGHRRTREEAGRTVRRHLPTRRGRMGLGRWDARTQREGCVRVCVSVSVWERQTERPGQWHLEEFSHKYHMRSYLQRSTRLTMALIQLKLRTPKWPNDVSMCAGMASDAFLGYWTCWGREAGRERRPVASASDFSWWTQGGLSYLDQASTLLILSSVISFSGVCFQQKLVVVRMKTLIIIIP